MKTTAETILYLLDQASCAAGLAHEDAKKPDYESALDGVEEALALLNRVQALLEEQVDGV